MNTLFLIFSGLAGIAAMAGYVYFKLFRGLHQQQKHQEKLLAQLEAYTRVLAA